MGRGQGKEDGVRLLWWRKPKPVPRKPVVGELWRLYPFTKVVEIITVEERSDGLGINVKVESNDTQIWWYYRRDWFELHEAVFIGSTRRTA